MTEYDTEQSNLEQRMSELETATERISTKAVQIDKFVRLVKKYRDFEELTTPMLNDFIAELMRISGSDAIIVMDNEVWYCIDGLPNRNLER